MFYRQFAPAMISSVGLAIGDMADAVVVGRSMGVEGLAAISLALPVFMVINVLMHGFGIGGSIRFSTLLAQGRQREAVSGFQGLLTVAATTGLLLALFGNFLLTPLLAVLGTTAADGALFEISRTYVRIILSGTPLIMTAYLLNYYLRNDNGEKLAGLGFTVGNLTDIALNIVLVLGLDMGAAGAAWATLAGQAVFISIYLTAFGKQTHTLCFSPFRPDFNGSFRCFQAGFSSSVQYLFSMLFILSANHILIHLSGSVGVAVFDMVQNASFLILYLYDGTAKAAQPLLSTYHGERNDAGRKHALHLSLKTGTAVGAVAILVVALFPGAVCHLFGLGGTQAMRLGGYALRVFCTGATFAGAGILLENDYQSCGEEKAAFVMTTLRGAAVLLPLTLLFSTFGQWGFWWLYPATEVVSLLAFALYRKAAKSGPPKFDTGRVFVGTIRNRNEEFTPLLTEITAFCEQWQATAKQLYFVAMTVEELCAVIMSKGFGEADGVIQVTLIAGEDGVFDLHIRDSAVSFNPFAMKTEKAGGKGDFNMDAIGMLVIKEKAKEFFYRRYQGFNTLIVKI
jgi:putative MATE family efflux protein